MSLYVVESSNFDVKGFEISMLKNKAEKEKQIFINQATIHVAISDLWQLSLPQYTYVQGHVNSAVSTGQGSPVKLHPSPSVLQVTYMEIQFKTRCH